MVFQTFSMSKNDVLLREKQAPLLIDGGNQVLNASPAAIGENTCLRIRK